MTLLQLVMIVKNGADTIGKVLESVSSHIDYWSILDTGSTDNTIDIIREKLSKVPGELFQEPFIDFGTSRNRILELAGNRCKYTLMLDDSYVLHGGSHLRRLIKKGNENGYTIRVTDNKENSEYYSVRLLKSSATIRYKYRIHETPSIDNAMNISENDIYILDLKTKKQNQRSYDRFESDLQMLLQEHAEHPRDTRIVRYLGVTCMALEQYEEAHKWFKKLLKMSNLGDEEKYIALTNDAVLQYKELGGTHEDYIRLLERAAKEIPYRAEPYYKLAIMYRQLGEMEKALKWIHLAANKPIPRLVDPIDISVYKKDIPYLMIEICLQLKIITEIVPLIKRMLLEYPTEQRFLNIKHAISNPVTSSLNRLELPIVVFHIHDEEQSNPRNKSTMSDRLNFVVKIGKMLRDLRYRVIIFSNFGKDECNYENIDYIHEEYYSEFVSKYIIHTLVATSGKYLCLYDNIEKVYLWSHDTYPTEEFIQIHPKKFKGILTISDWQIYNIQKAWGVPAENFTKIPYAIEMVNGEEKITNNFVYEPETIKDLENMYSIWPAIKEKYSDATLTVVGKDYTTPDSSVILEEDVEKALKKCSFWLSLYRDRMPYVSKIVRAQSAGCLCMAINTGAVPEILEGRGVLLEEFSENSREEILKKIFFAIDNQEIRNNMIEKSLAWSRQNSFERLGRTWLKLLL
jgi:glycosyltransferase involved in cell wall biosynthesis